MIKKVLIFNYTQWNQVVCSLIEGLKLNKNLELYSTTETNYAKDISIFPCNSPTNGPITSLYFNSKAEWHNIT